MNIPHNNPNPSNKDLLDKLQSLEERLDASDERFDKLEKSIAGLVEAWSTAKGLSSFIKWGSSLITGGIVLFTLLKDHVK